MRIIQARSAEHVINRLQDDMADSDFPSEKISALSMEYRRIYRLLRGPAPSVTTIARNSELDLEATRLGLRIELEQIQQAYEEGRISREGRRSPREGRHPSREGRQYPRKSRSDAREGEFFPKRGG